MKQELRKFEIDYINFFKENGNDLLNLYLGEIYNKKLECTFGLDSLYFNGGDVKYRLHLKDETFECSYKGNIFLKRLMTIENLKTALLIIGKNIDLGNENETNAFGKTISNTCLKYLPNWENVAKWYIND